MHLEAIQALKYVQNVLGYPEEYMLRSATGPEVQIRGRKIIMFGSYNYLNLANSK